MRGKPHYGAGNSTNIHGNTGLKQVGKGPPDATIKQAFAQYQNKMTSVRKGESTHYDLEAVGITKCGSPRGKIKPRTKTYEQIRKLDSRIFAEQVVKPITELSNNDQIIISVQTPTNQREDRGQQNHSPSKAKIPNLIS